MKKMVFLMVALLILFQNPVSAKNTKEQKMKENADELSYTGQLDQASELMGQDKKFSKQTADDGWSTTSLMFGLIWGSIGTGYFIYGKKQGRPVFLLCGIGLCVFPYVVPDLTWGIVLGLGMTFLPFKIDL